MWKGSSWSRSLRTRSRSSATGRAWSSPSIEDPRVVPHMQNATTTNPPPAEAAAAAATTAAAAGAPADKALERQAKMLGQLLVRRGVITAEQLASALARRGN